MKIDAGGKKKKQVTRECKIRSEKEKKYKYLHIKRSKIQYTSYDLNWKNINFVASFIFYNVYLLSVIIEICFI